MFRRPRPAGAALIGSALAVLLLAWWAWPDGEDTDYVATETPAVTPATTPEPVAEGSFVTIGDILSNREFDSGGRGELIGEALRITAAAPTRSTSIGSDYEG